MAPTGACRNELRVHKNTICTCRQRQSIYLLFFLSGNQFRTKDLSSTKTGKFHRAFEHRVRTQHSKDGRRGRMEGGGEPAARPSERTARYTLTFTPLASFGSELPNDTQRSMNSKKDGEFFLKSRHRSWYTSTARNAVRPTWWKDNDRF